MKKHLLAGFILSMSCTGVILAQNKTLGVGVTTPNPNAALHVEAPSGNQGFILPRLTTAQRNAAGFVSVLGASDNGLMVYDTDLKTIFIWNGASWKSSAQVAGGPKLVYPYGDTIASAPNNSELLRLVYAGSAVENVGVAHFENQNPNTGRPAVYATTNGSGAPTTSAAILGETSTAFSAITGIATGANGSNAIAGLSSSTNAFSFGVYGNNTGAGLAGMFEINNASNASSALEATTNGTGGAGRFRVSNPASGMPALWAETNSNQPLSAPVYGLNTGTGDVAASFRTTNASNNFSAIYAESNGTNGRGATFRKLGTGTGTGVFVESFGGTGLRVDNKSAANGYGAIIQNWEVTNQSPAIYAEAGGTGASIWALKSTDAVSGDALLAENWIATGRAATFALTDVNNPSSAIETTTAGTGAAGRFEQTNPDVWTPALIGQTNGLGAAVSGVSSPSSTNANAAEFSVQNPANPRFAVWASTQGTGSAVNAEISNVSSGAATIFTTTAGTGAALQAQTATGFASIYARREGATNGNAGIFEITNAGNTYPSLSANTIGTGSAANFQINNGSSTAPALWAATNGTGSGIAADNTSTGDAIFALKTGPGGSAGNFQSNNPANGAATIFGMTNASTGTALGLINSAEGNALTIFTGGLKVSVTTLSAGGAITARSAAYYITGGASYTISIPISDGEVFYFYNSTGSPVTVGGAAIPATSGKTCIVMGGALRAF